MDVDLICCAETCLVDKRSNKVTLVNIYDGMAISGFPAAIGPFTTVLLFRRTAGEPEQVQGFVRFFIDDQMIFQGPYDADFQGSWDTRVVGELAQLIIPRPGLFSARVISNEQELGRYCFIIDPIQEDAERLL